MDDAEPSLRVSSSFVSLRDDNASMDTKRQDLFLNNSDVCIGRGPRKDRPAGECPKGLMLIWRVSDANARACLEASCVGRYAVVTILCVFNSRTLDGVWKSPSRLSVINRQPVAYELSARAHRLF